MGEYFKERYRTMRSSKYFGRMNDPTASAKIKGLCGDEMEFYLYIEKSRIKEVTFYTENGCPDTIVAGKQVARFAENRDVMDALEISPKQILDALCCFSSENSKISDDGRHCAILAVSTLYKAIADYLLQ